MNYSNKIWLLLKNAEKIFLLSIKPLICVNKAIYNECVRSWNTKNINLGDWVTESTINSVNF